MNKEESKLEVGKKYLDEQEGIVTIVTDLRKFDEYEENYPFIGLYIDSDNPRPYRYSENGKLFPEETFAQARHYCLVKEHREPFKNAVETWVAYDDSAPVKGYLLDELLNKSCADCIYETKQKALAGVRQKAGKYRITIEELLEHE